MPATLLESNLVLDPADDYSKPPRGEDLPFEDGEPLESPWHRDAMNVLIHSLESHWLGRKDFYAGGNMFIHFSTTRVMNKDFRGPDFFLVLGTDHEPLRKSWVVWEEAGRYPNVVVELTSETTRHIDRVVKKELYRGTWRTGEYYCYDPNGHRIEGWRLVDSQYVPIEPDLNGRLWSSQMELYLGNAKGSLADGREDRWPRWFDSEGNLVLLPNELEKQRAEAEKFRADTAEAELVRLKLELNKLKGA